MNADFELTPAEMEMITKADEMKIVRLDQERQMMMSDLETYLGQLVETSRQAIESGIVTTYSIYEMMLFKLDSWAWKFHNGGRNHHIQNHDVFRRYMIKLNEIFDQIDARVDDMWERQKKLLIEIRKGEVETLVARDAALAAFQKRRKEIKERRFF